MSTDFQLVPLTDADPTPLDTPVEQVTVPAQTTTPARAPKTDPALNHTPGGLPAVPLAVIASNTTIAGLSAAAIVAGPLGAAAAGVVAVGGVVAVRASAARAGKRRPAPARTEPKNGRGTVKASTVRTASGSTTARGTGTRSSGSAGRKTTSTGARPTAGTGGRRTTATGSRSTGTTARKTPPAVKKPTGRVGQVKALRKAKTAAAPTRKDRRTADTAARRALKDTRREARRNAKTSSRPTVGPARTGAAPARGKTTPAPTKTTTTPRTPSATSPAAARRQACTKPVKDTRTSPVGRLRTRVQNATDHARTHARGKRDQAVVSRRDRIRNARRNAKATATLGRRIAASTARYGMAAAGRAALAAPVGALGLLTTPLGRKLGWTWLQYPGRRLYRRLTARARAAHQARIADAKTKHTTTLNPAPTGPEPTAQIADNVQRAPRTSAAPTTTGDTEVSEDIKLHFLEASEDTVSAARAYEPGGMLHVRQVIKAMPIALENWAMTFAVLAEKSDAEFPLEGEIGEGLDDIHQQMRGLIDRAEDLAQTFDRLHEHDIERLRNPRKSAEAEKTWDTGANEDYDTE